MWKLGGGLQSSRRGNITHGVRVRKLLDTWTNKSNIPLNINNLLSPTSILLTTILLTRIHKACTPFQPSLLFLVIPSQRPLYSLSSLAITKLLAVVSPTRAKHINQVGRQLALKYTHRTARRTPGHRRRVIHPSYSWYNLECRLCHWQGLLAWHWP